MFPKFLSSSLIYSRVSEEIGKSFLTAWTAECIVAFVIIKGK